MNGFNQHRTHRLPSSEREKAENDVDDAQLAVSKASETLNEAQANYVHAVAKCLPHALDRHIIAALHHRQERALKMNGAAYVMFRQDLQQTCAGVVEVLAANIESIKWQMTTTGPDLVDAIRAVMSKHLARDAVPQLMDCLQRFELDDIQIFPSDLTLTGLPKMVAIEDQLVIAYRNLKDAEHREQIAEGLLRRVTIQERWDNADPNRDQQAAEAT